MKMNKKGFTLIEMLVVIAIIAVLVSIVIPVVGNSTDKAGAATNAANLRSITAAAQVANLQATTPSAAGTITVTNGKATVGGTEISCPSSVKCGLCAKGVVPTITIDAAGNVTVKYGSNGIEEFAAAAGGGTTADATQATQAP